MLAGISFFGHLGNVTQTKKGNFVSLQNRNLGYTRLQKRQFFDDHLISAGITELSGENHRW